MSNLNSSSSFVNSVFSRFSFSGPFFLKLSVCNWKLEIQPRGSILSFPEFALLSFSTLRQVAIVLCKLQFLSYVWKQALPFVSEINHSHSEQCKQASGKEKRAVQTFHLFFSKKRFYILFLSQNQTTQKS